MQRKIQGPAMPRRHRITGAVMVLMGISAQAQEAAGAAEPAAWQTNVYYQNDTRFRGEDNTGDTVGLSKFRNTIQVEAQRGLGSGWEFQSVLRGTWDGVYRLNADQYGNSAGGPIHLENSAGPGLAGIGSPVLNTATVVHGGGLNNPVAAAFGLPPSNAFGFNSTSPAAANYNPNVGLRVLGDRWHATGGGVGVGVPVRPCDVDSRGCKDFGGYGDKTRSQLEAPEFNNRLDFIREIAVKNTIDLADGKALFVKVGKQQVVWGRTDLFRVLDVVNPVDFSRNNIYDELEDIRIPSWIAQAEYRMGASESMQDRNLQLVVNFDKFRANNLGQCGTPNAALDAGCFFRGMANLWDNGGTVSNFAPSPAGGMIATDFGRHQIGLRNVNLPGYTLKNAPVGVKFEGVTTDGFAFSLNALTSRSQFPSLHAFNTGAINPFTGAVGNASGTPVRNLIAFDMYFPRVNLIGGSVDFKVDSLNTAVRMEAALTYGEEFANTNRAELYSRNRVFRGVLGLDRPTLIPFISANRTTLISAQLFYQHIDEHELVDGPLGKVGMADWKDNAIGTLLIKAFLMNDRVSPQMIMARDLRAKAWVVSPSVDWSITDSLKWTLGANVKGRRDENAWKTDDCRSCNPYPPFSGADGGAGSAGLSGLEPLGRFRAGPIGAAWKENEIFTTVKYKF